MTATLTPFDRARRYVEKTPGAISGQGGHAQTFALAMALIHGFCLGEHEAWPLLVEYNGKCQPPWSERELRHKLTSALSTAPAKQRGWLLEGQGKVHHGAHKPKPAPRLTPTAAVEKYCSGFEPAEVDIWEASPVRLDGPPQSDFTLAIAHLYQPGERINVVTKHGFNEHGKPIPSGSGITRTREQWLTAGVPVCPAGGWQRMNPLGGAGVADSNVSAFRFALVECDTLPLELQLRLVAKLPLPVALVLTSGKRSIHAWVRVDAANLDEYRAATSKLLELLAPFGVDGKNKNPSRLSRLPGGHRQLDGEPGRQWQRILYLNPNPNPKGLFA